MFSLLTERGNLSYGVIGLNVQGFTMIGKSKNSKSYREVALEKTALLPKVVYVNSDRIH